jgi:hypothetical protein
MPWLHQIFDAFEDFKKTRKREAQEAAERAAAEQAGLEADVQYNLPEDEDDRPRKGQTRGRGLSGIALARSRRRSGPRRSAAQLEKCRAEYSASAGGPTSAQRQSCHSGEDCGQVKCTERRSIGW